MERLTKMLKNGSVVCRLKFEKPSSCNDDCDKCLHDMKAWNKLAEYEELEERGMLLKIPESDWNDLIKQIATIVANDFIVYSDEREYIANQIFSLEYDEEFRFTATCRCFNGTENDWWCDEECEHGEDGKGCYITFNFSDIGKTIFLTKEEAESALEEMEKH